MIQLIIFIIVPFNKSAQSKTILFPQEIIEENEHVLKVHDAGVFQVLAINQSEILKNKIEKKYPALQKYLL